MIDVHGRKSCSDADGWWCGPSFAIGGGAHVQVIPSVCEEARRKDGLNRRPNRTAQRDDVTKPVRRQELTKASGDDGAGEARSSSSSSSCVKKRQNLLKTLPSGPARLARSGGNGTVNLGLGFRFGSNCCVALISPPSGREVRRHVASLIGWLTVDGAGEEEVRVVDGGLVPRRHRHGLEFSSSRQAAGE